MFNLTPIITTTDCLMDHPKRHVGKFDSCRDEVLYSIEADETTGSVDWRYHVSLIHVETDSIGIDSQCDLGTTILVSAGLYLVFENDQGHVRVEHYEDINEGQKVFSALAAEYAAWDTDED